MSHVFHPADKRGVAEHGWLHTRFSFSFADWHDPERMGFGALRVLNDDRIDPSSGFDLHAHRDMEIVTIVRRGTVTHEDSMGNGEKIRAGEVQVMTAGSGVAHSEHNRSATEPLELFQIWILPRERRLQPRYAQYAFDEPAPGKPQLLVSPTGEGESIMVHQDAYITRLRLAAGDAHSYARRMRGNGAYVFVESGSAVVDGQALGPRDAVGLWDVSEVPIAASPDDGADMLIIEVPMLEE